MTIRVAVLGVCLGIALLGASLARAAVAPTAYDIRESFTVSGDLVAGNIVNLTSVRAETLFGAPSSIKLQAKETCNEAS